MKILFINAIYGEKSSGTSIKDLVDAAKDCGYEAFVATPYDYGEAPYYYRIGNLIDHKIHAILARIFGKQGFFSSIETYRFIRYIKNIKPDVIHMQVIHGNFLNFKILAKYFSSANIPAVFVLDDCWYFTGKCFHYTSVNCNKWEYRCGNCPKLKEKMMPSWFFDKTGEVLEEKRKIFKSLDRYAVVAVSDWLLAEAKKSIMGSATIMTRIYNSINLDIFKYRINNIRHKLHLDNKFIILGVAVVLDGSKGLSDFVALSSLIDKNWQIVIIGKIPEYINLPSNIISVGTISDPLLLSEYYSMADVFLQMSKEETFGKVTAEALACGTPAIVYNSTANPELIGEKCGYVVEPGDLSAVIDRLKDIEMNTKQFYSNHCRLFIENNMNMEVNTKLYLDLYKNIIGVS